MESVRWPGLPGLLAALGLDETPLALFFADAPPEGALNPAPLEQPTRQRELAGEINWGAVFGGFTCAIGHLWRARRKHKPAWFSADHYGCPGAFFWLGFTKPQTEAIVHYVSSGIPNQMHGERYLATPDECRAVFAAADPPPVPKPYLVAKPIDLMAPAEEPELVVFFARPEALAGLHQLATFVTGRPEIVRSPFSAGCGSIVGWPRHYLAQGEDMVAVLGGWDPSARKYYKTDELSFTVSAKLFAAMVEKWPGSFLAGKTWAGSRQKIARSRRAWGEDQ
ncbi:MAG: DUF169 domain-containing protein [Pseudomonadota bacterium]